MPSTTNFGWTTPADTDLVKDGASAIRSLGTSIDTTTKALNPSTTLGDIEYRSSTANTNTRLGIGTDGQVLTVSSGVPAWATSSSGGMTLLTSGTLSGSAVNLTSISSSYKDLKLVIRNFKPATDGARIYLRLNNDTGANYQTPGISSGSNQSFSDTYMIASYQTDNTSAQGLCIYEIDDYTNTTTWKIVRLFAMTNNDTTATNFQLTNQFGAYNQTGAISQINILLNSGNFTSGDYYLYGVK